MGRRAHTGWLSPSQSQTWAATMRDVTGASKRLAAGGKQGGEWRTAYRGGEKKRWGGVKLH